MRVLAGFPIACLLACSARMPPEVAGPADGGSAGGTPSTADGGPVAGAPATDPVPPAARLTLSVSISGGGRVVSIPAGVDCDANCEASFAEGTRVTVAANPQAGFRFTAWSGRCRGEGDCELDMRSDAQISASFERRPAAARYVVAELPPMDGIANLWPTSINSHGDVVGIDLTQPTGPKRAFLYDATSGMTRRLLAEATSSQTATAINDAREIVGWVVPDGAAQSQRAVRWNAGTVSDPSALPPLEPGVDVAVAQAINNRGLIAGWSVPSRAVVWDATGPHDLGTGAAPGSVALAINGRSVAAGVTFYQNERGNSEGHAAVFDGTGVRELGTLPGMENSWARAINDAGRVVGSSFPTAHPDEWRAFVYDLPHGPMRNVSPDGRCELRAVSSDGLAVGYCATGRGADFLRYAAILRGEVVEDLNDIVRDPKWVLTDAQSINDAGQIAGYGLHDGQPRGFVLTPR